MPTILHNSPDNKVRKTRQTQAQDKPAEEEGWAQTPICEDSTQGLKLPPARRTAHRQGWPGYTAVVLVAPILRRGVQSVRPQTMGSLT